MTEDSVKVSVQDRGPGINETTKDQMFRAFHTTKPEGMGMGLSLCHSIIEAHGGRLWAENCPDGSGAMFSIHSPDTERHGAMTESEALVFVVDDDDSVRKALARLIRSVGLNVETFASAGEFLARGPHDGSACLILDVRMPGLSGLDLQKELAASGIPSLSFS